MEAHEVFEHISRQKRGRTDFRHLARQLGARGSDRAVLRQILRKLIEDGRLVEYRTDRFAVPRWDSEFLAGRLTLHRDGYGFVIPDHPIPGVEGDIFIGSRALGDAMHGDRVLVRVTNISEERRAEGRIQRIVKRKHTTIVGEFRHAREGSYVIPHDERLREYVWIAPGDELPPADAKVERLGNATPPKVERVEDLDRLIVNVEVLQFPTKLEPAWGRVIEVLGKPDDFGVDVEVIIRKFHLPHHFPAEVREETETLSSAIDDKELPRRRDFRGYDIVTIDGETARDFDDAVWVERLENGNFALHVHIADVSHYVQSGSAIDREARLRGTSVYFPDRAVPMLPAELSTDVCSLNPGVDRLVLSVLLEIDNRGATVKTEFHRGVIRSVERMTYTNVNKVLEGDEEQRARYRPLIDRFELMKDLAMVLNRRRQRRGSIDFDLPEPVIEFDEFGLMVGVIRSERNIAHRIIEEFMLAANEAVARNLEEAEAASPYRIHEKPEGKRVLDFEQLTKTFGYSLGVDVPQRQIRQTHRRRDGSKATRRQVIADSGIDISPKHYQKLIRKIADKPEERILSYLMLRSLKQARYSEKNVGHFALATDCYTHFTSPIRRYPDLIVHRILKTVLEAGPSSPYGAEGREGPLPESEVAVVASESSFAERRAADAERALIDWKKARFMEERLGDEFDAIVIQVIRAGMLVELLDLFIEGLVPIDSLQDGRYLYREEQRALVNHRSKKRYTIGDRVRVRADRISFVEMRPEFSVVEKAVSKKRQ